MWYRAHSQEHDLDMWMLLSATFRGRSEFYHLWFKAVLLRIHWQNRFKIKHIPIDDIFPCNWHSLDWSYCVVRHASHFILHHELLVYESPPCFFWRPNHKSFLSNICSVLSLYFDPGLGRNGGFAQGDSPHNEKDEALDFRYVEQKHFRTVSCRHWAIQ